MIPDQYSEAGRSTMYNDLPRPPSTRAPSEYLGSAAHGPMPPRQSQTIWNQFGNAPQQPDKNGTFVQIEPASQTMTQAFTPHGLLSSGLQDKNERSAKKQEELARETGASLINVPNKPPPPQTGLLGAITAHERDRKREGGVGAALTEREREKRMAEERQRKIDELQRQQLEFVQQQGGSMYGAPQGYNAFNPMMMMNPMMTGMNPMMTGNPMMGGYMGYPGMVPGYGNQQHIMAAQQAAAQAYQQAMMTFSQAGGSQIGGEGGRGGAGSPGPGQMGPMNPMMTGGASPMPMSPMMTGMGGYDPRFSMMNPMMTPMGMHGMGGMPMQMTGGGGSPGFDNRFSQFDPGLQPPNAGFNGESRVSSHNGSPLGPRPIDGGEEPPRLPPATGSPRHPPQ